MRQYFKLRACVYYLSHLYGNFTIFSCRPYCTRLLRVTGVMVHVLYMNNMVMHNLVHNINAWFLTRKWRKKKMKKKTREKWQAGVLVNKLVKAIQMNVKVKFIIGNSFMALCILAHQMFDDKEKWLETKELIRDILLKMTNKDRRYFQTIYSIEYFIKRIRFDLKELVETQRNLAQSDRPSMPFHLSF